MITASQAKKAADILHKNLMKTELEKAQACLNETLSGIASAAANGMYGDIFYDIEGFHTANCYVVKILQSLGYTIEDKPEESGVLVFWGESQSISPSSLYANYNTWANATFRTEAVSGTLNHLRREAEELAANPDDDSEFADVQMLLWNAWDKTRSSGLPGLMRAVANKFHVNKNREWGEPDSDGVISHVKK